jgi:hypothetical protein
MSYGVTPTLPSLRMDDYKHSSVVEYLSLRHARNKNLSFGVNQYAHGLGTPPVTNAYYGGCYSPTQNRIYFIPASQSDQATWHYIDCNTGAVVAYAHGLSVLPVIGSYRGGCYSPTQNRIYFIPASQSNQSTWHYIDCTTGAIVAYTHGLGTLPVANAYYGGCYSPTQNRIYFMPSNQADQTSWHYIDCNTGSVVAYAHGLSVLPIQGAYSGGCYSPTQNRIYLSPYGQANQSTWHYIDCNTGAVVEYTHGLGVLPVQFAYVGVGFSPIQNRIYLSPYLQSSQTTWHYIDCNTGGVIAYTHGLGTLPVGGAYLYMVYSPTSNKMFLCPQSQGDQAKWHYIDGNSGGVLEYAHGISAQATPYRGGVYSPTQNRIYLTPFVQANQATWHYIQEYSSADVSPTLMAGTLFNKL